MCPVVGLTDSVPWSTACRLILISIALCSPEPEPEPPPHSQWKKYNLFLIKLSLFALLSQKTSSRLWLLTFFMERSFCRKIYSLQGMKIKLSQHVCSPHQIRSNNKEKRSFLSGFVTQKTRMWVSPMKLQISLE